MRQSPDYGIDGPVAVLILIFVSGVLFGAVGVAVVLGLGAPHPSGIAFCAIGALVGVNLLSIAGGMLVYSKFAKLRLRERLRDLIPWRGDETVLDVGCGRGLLLIGAARLLKTGKATGVDIWRNDLSGNRADAALENARLEGVADRVAVQEGDARSLPFADASIDVVVSGLTLHNIRDRAGRRQAVTEIARVLKPGGHVVVLDLSYTSEYVLVLRQCGVSDAKRLDAWRGLSLGFMLISWGAVRFCWVTGQKAAAGEGDHGPTDVAGRVRSLLEVYWRLSGGITLDEAESFAKAHGFGLELGRVSRFENARTSVIIAKADLLDGKVNRLLLAEEIQHGLDRATFEASRAIRLGLSNEQFHAQLFQRILVGYANGRFQFLAYEDLAALRSLIARLSKR